MNMHFFRVHNVNKEQRNRQNEKFICSACGKMFLAKNSLRRHKKLVHDKFRYQCTKCNMRVCNLSRHIQSIHEERKNNDKQTQTCNLCGNQFSSQGTLSVHFKSVHDKVRYVCNKCGYKATRTDNLKTHIKTVHEGNKFPCSVCDYKATHKSNLAKHIKTFHKSSTYTNLHPDKPRKDQHVSPQQSNKPGGFDVSSIDIHENPAMILAAEGAEESKTENNAEAEISDGNSPETIVESALYTDYTPISTKAITFIESEVLDERKEDLKNYSTDVQPEVEGEGSDKRSLLPARVSKGDEKEISEQEVAQYSIAESVEPRQQVDGLKSNQSAGSRSKIIKLSRKVCDCDQCEGRKAPEENQIKYQNEKREKIKSSNSFRLPALVRTEQRLNFENALNTEASETDENAKKLFEIDRNREKVLEASGSKLISDKTIVSPGLVEESYFEAVSVGEDLEESSVLDENLTKYKSKFNKFPKEMDSEETPLEALDLLNMNRHELLRLANTLDLPFQYHKRTTEELRKTVAKSYIKSLTSNLRSEKLKHVARKFKLREKKLHRIAGSLRRKYQKNLNIKIIKTILSL